MLHILTEAVSRTFTIGVFVFVMMLLVDYVNVLTGGRLSALMKKGKLRQYVSASFLGATPGCLGAFMTVSFYLHGLISFGAIFGCMVATSGDEAFVMLASFPRQALILFGTLFVMGAGLAWFADAAGRLVGFRYAEGCQVEVFHSHEECRCFDRTQLSRQLRAMCMDRGLLLVAFAAAIVAGAIGFLEEGWEGTTIIVLAGIGAAIVGTVPDHYLRTHIVGHIVKKHIWKVVLWTFFALLIVATGLKYWDLKSFAEQHTILLIPIAALVGLIPQSGPHLIFVTMFAQGIVPSSVLLTSCIVQDGHALLPVLSCSVRDALTIKGMKLLLGLVVGFLLHAFRW